MQESEQFSSLIGDIYDTVLDRSLWPTALRNASGFIQGQASAIFWKDAASNCGDVFFDDGGITPEFRRLYFEKYIALNPTTTPRFFMEAGEPAATADLLPYDEFLQTRFYLEWAKPQGLVDFVSVFLEKAAPKAAMFGVFRHERHGVVDADTRQRLRLVAPHIQRAVLISKVIDFKQAEAASLAQAFDGLRAGMILVDSEGRVLHANAAAHAILDEGRVLRVSRGRLISGDVGILILTFSDLSFSLARVRRLCMVSLFVRKASAISSIPNPHNIRNDRAVCDSRDKTGSAMANIICSWLSLIFSSERSISVSGKN